MPLIQNFPFFKYWAFFLFFFLISLPGVQPTLAQNRLNQNNVVISFEEAAPPNFVSVQNGSIKNIALRSRYGDKSLEWKWTTASSTLIIDNAPGMDYTKSKDQILMWIYNETPMPDTSKKLVFHAGSKATMKDADPNNDQYFEFDFFLNFKGWRAMGINLQEEGTWKGKKVIL